MRSHLTRFARVIGRQRIIRDNIKLRSLKKVACAQQRRKFVAVEQRIRSAECGGLLFVRLSLGSLHPSDKRGCQMLTTKLIAALTVTTALGVGAASAADLAARPYNKAPAYIEPIFNWTGFYVGGHLGGSWTNQEWINTVNSTAFGDLSPGQGFGQHGSGVFGGGQVGYNWQAGNWVFGLEGTVSGLDNRGTVVNTVFGFGLDDRFSWRTDWMATITGRVGYAVANNLFYAKGGYAGANNRLSVVDTNPNPSTGSGAASNWHNGWTLGAGWEYGITQNWIVGVEYDYASFQKKDYQLAGTAPGVYSFDARPRDIQSVVGRVSYKFGGPLVARY
jgi:outer membrane immunogenic protein